MATYIKTLKEDNGDITYPQTTTDAVLTTSGTTLETELGKCVKAEEIGSTADITPTITTAMIKDSAVTTTKIADSAVTSAKIDWTTLGFKTGTMSAVTFTNSGSWSAANVGSSVSVTGLEPSTLYKVTLCCKFTDGLGGEARLVCTGASTSTLVMYVNSTSTNGLFGFTLIGTAKSSSSGTMTLQRAYSGGPVTNARYGDCTWFVERIG